VAASHHSIATWLSWAREVRLRDAIGIAIPSFIKLLTDGDEPVRLAALRVLHGLADDSGLQSDSIVTLLTRM
jgi:HEAT repeat protein